MDDQYCGYAYVLDFTLIANDKGVFEIMTTIESGAFDTNLDNNHVTVVTSLCSSNFINFRKSVLIKRRFLAKRVTINN